jgi:hypothetical protein
MEAVPFIFGTVRECFQQILKKLVCPESKYVHLLLPAFGHKVTIKHARKSRA